MAPKPHTERCKIPAPAPLSAAIGLALAAIAPAGLMADDTPKAERNEHLEEVEVYGQRQDDYLPDGLADPHYTADLLDTARTVNVITADVMHDQAATSLSDVLANVPGISMQAGEGGTPAGDQLSIRGFSARTDIFVDGVRDFGGYSRDSYNLEQVEVAKGPGSNYTGRGSTGGSINLVSKTARGEDFMLAGGSYGTPDYKRATVDLNRVIGETTAFRLNLMAHDADVPDRNEVENTRYGIAPTVTFGLGTETRWTFAYQHLWQDNVPDYGIPWVPASNTVLTDYHDQPVPVDDSNWYGMLERDYEEVENGLFTARVEHDFGNDMRFGNQFRWGNTERDSLITAPRFAGTDSTDIRRTDWKSRDQQDRILNNLTTLAADFATGSVLHSFVAGVELSDEYERNYDRDITGDQPDTDLWQPNPNDHWGGTIFRTGGYSESDGLNYSVFAGDTMTLSDHWLLTAGLRWDRFELDYTDRADDGSAETYSRTDSDWSYQGSLVYKPADNGSIYLGYGTSFNPSGEGLTLASRRSSLADVEPEESESWELGTKWELLDARLLLSAALFRTEKTNARETDPVDSSLIILSGEQRVEGVELGAVGQLTETLNVVAGYTHMDSEITESVDPAMIGNELGNTPHDTWNLWVNWHALPALQLGVGTQYVDERYSNTRNTRVAPDYQLYSAMASWAVNESLALRFNATNLTDEDYLGNVGGGHAIPGPGRQVIFSVDYTP